MLKANQSSEPLMKKTHGHFRGSFWTGISLVSTFASIMDIDRGEVTGYIEMAGVVQE